jgi:hypothetical protein
VNEQPDRTDRQQVDNITEPSPVRHEATRSRRDRKPAPSPPILPQQQGEEEDEMVHEVFTPATIFVQVEANKI